MTQRDQFIKQFVETGKAKGASKEEVASKLEVALQDFDSKYSQPKQDQKSFVQKAGEFITPSFSKLGQVLGAGLSQLSPEAKQAQESQARLDALNAKVAKRAQKEKDPEIKALLQNAAQQGVAASTQIAQNQASGLQESSGLSDKELAKTPAEFAARTGVSTGAELASFLTPQGATATTGLGRIGRAALTGGKVGGLVGLSEAAREADTLSEVAGTVAGQTALGAVAGAGIQTGAEGLRKAQQGFGKAADYLKKKGYDAYSRTFKENQSAQRLIDKKGGPERLAKGFIEEGIPKTKTGVQKEIRKLNSQYEKEVSKKLKTLGKTRKVDVDKIIDDTISEAKNIYNLPDPKTQRELKDFVNYLESFRGQYSGPKGNLNNVNELRKLLDKSYYGVDPSRVVDGEKLANDLLSNNLRQAVQEKAPLTQKFFKRYSLLKTAENIFYKEPKTGIVEFTAAAASPGTGAVNILEFLGGKAFRSPGVARTGASLISGGKQKSSALPLPGGVSKTGASKPSYIINPTVQALQRLIDKENQQKQERPLLR